MCEQCWTHQVDGDSWCAHCVAHAKESSPAALPAVFFGVSASLIGAGWMAFRDMPDVLLPVCVASAVTVVTLIMLVRRQAKVKQRRIVARVAEKALAPTPFAAPTGYRLPPRMQAARVLAPPVSGHIIALLLLLALLLPVALVPAVFRLPPWLAVEGVLGVWWSVWVLTFAWLLFRGRPVADDVFSTEKEDDGGDGVSLGDFSGFGDFEIEGEGALAVFVIILALIALLIVSWLLAEFVVPLLFLCGYYLVTRALRHVVNDQHGCEGKPLKSLFWACAWATAYTAPLALITVGVHYFLALSAP